MKQKDEPSVYESWVRMDAAIGTVVPVEHELRKLSDNQLLGYSDALHAYWVVLSQEWTRRKMAKEGMERRA